jgi:choline dehydrogenase-like flavoprotein
MLIDARRVPRDEVLETEVCIVGAGPAGITLARELIGQGFRVCLLETGGFEPDTAIQNLATAANEAIGDVYPAVVSTRYRQYGGTANTWDIDMGNGRRGVRYVPLDPIDFEKREGIPYSGWPITRADLDPYYDRAQTVCQAGPYDYDIETWADETTPPIAFKGDRVTTRLFQFGPRDVFTQTYRSELVQSQNVTLCIYATALELESDELGKRVTRVRVGDLSGNRFWVAAQTVVLALGGLETARLLLLSNQVQQTGLGNSQDLVGRFLMDHPVVRSGILTPSNRQVIPSLSLYDTRWIKNTMVIAKPVLTETVMRQEQLLNINTAMFPRHSIFQYNVLRMLFPKGSRFRSPAVNSAREFAMSLKRGKLPDHPLKRLSQLPTGMDDMIYYYWRKKPRIHYSYGLNVGGWSTVADKKFGCLELFHVTEQAPDPANRVTLSDVRDPLGYRKLQVYWRWNDIDVRSTKRALEIFAEEFAQAGLGRLKLDLDQGVPQVFLPSTHHHMGTTRMHDNPKQGVVDANCQVHGMSNLFIASSSVFPTGGYANPTLTIIALAIRIADHIKTSMKQQDIALERL